MKKITLLMAVVFMVGLVSSLFAADVLVHEGAQVQITIPENWTQTQDGDSLTVVAPNEEMSIAFMVLDPSVADKALDQIDKEVDKTIGKVTWENDGNSIEDNINGMICDVWDGTAQGGKIQIECIVIDAPSGKNLCIYWFDTPESEKKYEAEIGMIVRGLKPIVAPEPAPTEETADEGDEGEEGTSDDEQ